MFFAILVENESCYVRKTRVGCCNGKGKFVPLLKLIKHYVMKAYGGVIYKLLCICNFSEENILLCSRHKFHRGTNL
jgi:hypothetical protein